MNCPYCGTHTYFDQESPCASIELWECGTRYDSVVGCGYEQSSECARRVKEQERTVGETEDMENEVWELFGEKPSKIPTVNEYQSANTRGLGETILSVVGSVLGTGCIFSILYGMLWMLLNCKK